MKIIKNILIDEIELVPYILKIDDLKLKKEYLNWLNDKEVIKYISSQEMHQRRKDLSFIHESFKRFTSDTCKG